MSMGMWPEFKQGNKTYTVEELAGMGSPFWGIRDEDGAMRAYVRWEEELDVLQVLPYATPDISYEVPVDFLGEVDAEDVFNSVAEFL